MVAYATYAEKLHWTPQQVDQLTIGQDDWIMTILNAVDEQRSYNEKKALEAQERKAEAKRRRGFL
jgi:hypothetical protein